MRARKKPNVMERGSVSGFSVFFRPNHESAPVALLPRWVFLTPRMFDCKGVLLDFEFLLFRVALLPHWVFLTPRMFDCKGVLMDFEFLLFRIDDLGRSYAVSIHLYIL